MFKTLTFTALALIAFAANSVLCRLALAENRIGASGLTSIRLLSGAAMLLLLMKVNGQKKVLVRGNWLAGAMLFVYAITFSLAYMSLTTGTGALVLFGSVQLTMILSSLASGTHLGILQWMGIAIAAAGVVYLVFPGVTAPSSSGFILMALAGIAWGLYTILGRTSKQPLADTTGNFLRTVPLVLMLTVATARNAYFTAEGIWLALLSGIIASAVGYTLWYLALGGLSTIQAAVVQLSVPVIAALGGIVFMSETLTLRFMLSALMLLGGILLVILGRGICTDNH